MTSITLTVKGAKVCATVDGLLTSGMTGLPIFIKYDDAWNGLTKNLVCRCGKWGPEEGETRTILNVGETASVASEVMRAGMYLYVGIEGYSANGELVMPTAWAPCGKIQHGANSGADLSADSTLPVWAQIQADVKDLREDVEELKNRPGGEDSDGNANQGTGWTAEQINLLDQLFNYIPWTSADAGAIADSLIASLRSGDTGGEDKPDTPVEPDEPVVPEKTLTSISAVYNGGDVAVGTAVSALTGIVVTAHYSDGSTALVTGYTLSGTIGEGENTVTIGYGGMTATFSVTGVAESGGEDETSTWGIGYFKNDGSITALESRRYCETYFPVSGGQGCYLYNTNRNWKGNFTLWATYDEDKTFINRLNADAHQGISDNGRCLFNHANYSLPDNAAFIRVCTDAGIEGYEDTAIITTEMPEPVLTLEDAVWYESARVSGSGPITTGGDYCCSDLISVEAGAKYRFGNSNPDWAPAWYGIGFYSDITEKFITRLTTAEFTVPDGAKYLRLSAQNITGYCETVTLEKIS